MFHIFTVNSSDVATVSLEMVTSSFLLVLMIGLRSRLELTKMTYFGLDSLWNWDVNWNLEWQDLKMTALGGVMSDP